MKYNFDSDLRFALLHRPFQVPHRLEIMRAQTRIYFDVILQDFASPAIPRALVIGSELNTFIMQSY